ncbi:hypothetical protein DFH11DRAFT_470693 [Phellopilus nigrolimitatus]|nr:hypothetical protein DFH11DRAFT_470693 [Phellopilus nigrolimitatus]
MLKHLGFSCWVSCQGKELPAYGEECRENVKSAWIPSEAGENFSVFWQDRSGKRIATSGHVFVDGKDVASAIIRPGRETPVERAGAKKNARKILPFTFSELSLTDDDTLADRFDPTIRDVGVIKVEIKRVRLGDTVRFTGYDAENLGFVHERAKKAGAHCTKFGTEERSKNPRTVAISTAPYDPNEPGAYVTFEFRYRSQAMLKATGIIENGRKRPNESSDDVIEIESSDDESLTTPSRTRSYSRELLRTPKKKVKREPQPDGVSPVHEDTQDDEHRDPSFHGTEALMASSTAASTLNGSSDSSQKPMSDFEAAQAKSPAMGKNENEDEDEGEELDMLVDDGEGNNSSKNGNSLDVPPSSSPGPQLHPLEDEDEDDS